ncbi:MAG: chromate transporter [Bacteroidaceae bacterium]|nr:chromate transporter [Bacteroidaceae bacterium]
MSTYTDIFLTFAKIGSFTLGGGFAMVQMMEKEVVDKKQWLSHEEFMDTLVVAQSTPGLFAIDMASHIGLKLKGVKGGIVGALGTALPSIVAILLIALFFQTFKGNVYVEKIFMVVRPCVVALILAPCFGMASKAKLSKTNWWIPVVTALLIAAFGVSPIWCILAAGVGGFLWGQWNK